MSEIPAKISASYMITSSAMETAKMHSNGFMSFLSEYKVIPLAIGVVMGVAVNDVVKSIVDGIITPLIGLLTKLANIDSLSTLMVGDFKIGLVISAIISFIAVAFVVFTFAKVIMKDDAMLEKAK